MRRRVAAAAAKLVADIGEQSERLGSRVTMDAKRALLRNDCLTLTRPGRISANGTCRLVRARDGWLAVNLARESDLDLVPAWSGSPWGCEAWPTVTAYARAHRRDDLVERAITLGLPVTAVAERRPGALPYSLPLGKPGPVRRRLRVIDLSTIWAGPLCGSVFAAMGADVLKVECVRRPDTTRQRMPRLDLRLNGAKRHWILDFKNPTDLDRLRERIADADVVITSARPRAFMDLGLDPALITEGRDGGVWIAVTGHGWTGEAGRRVGFGDDAAVAGGLVTMRKDGRPHFIGDAIADPLTGLAAAAAALRALAAGGGALIDASLAETAARTAHEMAFA